MKTLEIEITVHLMLQTETILLSINLFIVFKDSRKIVVMYINIWKLSRVLVIMSENGQLQNTLYYI